MGIYVVTVYIRVRENGTPYVNHVSGAKCLRGRQHPSRAFYENSYNIDPWSSHDFQAFRDMLRQSKFEMGPNTPDTEKGRLHTDRPGCHRICVYCDENSANDLILWSSECNSMFKQKNTRTQRPDVSDLIEPSEKWAQKCRPRLLVTPAAVHASPPVTPKQDRPCDSATSWRSPPSQESPGSSPTTRSTQHCTNDLDRQVDTEQPKRPRVRDLSALNEMLHRCQDTVDHAENVSPPNLTFGGQRDISPEAEAPDQIKDVSVESYASNSDTCSDYSSPSRPETPLSTPASCSPNKANAKPKVHQPEEKVSLPPSAGEDFAIKVWGFELYEAIQVCAKQEWTFPEPNKQRWTPSEPSLKKLDDWFKEKCGEVDSWRIGYRR